LSRKESFKIQDKNLPNLRGRKTQSSIMENLYKNSSPKEVSKLDKNQNKHLNKLVSLSKECKIAIPIGGEEEKIKKELDKLSNINWIHDSLSLYSDNLALSRRNILLLKKKAEVANFFSSLFDISTKNKSNSWIGCERIDLISLENLLKSFFKKMYSLISLPILEYLPDK
jgi:hypothetical protein